MTPSPPTPDADARALYATGLRYADGRGSAISGAQLAEYPLRLSFGRAAGAVGVVAALAAVSAGLALTNREAASLLGLVTLTPAATTWAFWGCAAFFALVALATARKGVPAGRRVAFAAGGVWLPRSVWSARHVLVQFADVRGARVVRRGPERVLEVDLPGRRFRVGERWLPSPAALDDIAARLRAGMAAGEGEPPPPWLAQTLVVGGGTPPLHRLS